MFTERTTQTEHVHERIELSKEKLSLLSKLLEMTEFTRKKSKSFETYYPKKINQKNKKFKCQYDGCAYESKHKSNLTRHIRTHTGEKPYK